MSREEIKEALEIFRAYVKSFKKGEAVYSMGEVTDYMGIILEGSVTVERNDYWGRKTLLMKKHAGEEIGTSFAQLENAPFTVDVFAAEPSTLLFIKIGSYDRKRTEKKEWYGQMARNLLTIANNATLSALRRNSYITPRKIRERVFAYLNTQVVNNRARSFFIPFSRQQMAEYLNVDRSALSKELSLMREEGYIDFRKNHFTVLADTNGKDIEEWEGVFGND